MGSKSPHIRVMIRVMIRVTVIARLQTELGMTSKGAGLSEEISTLTLTLTLTSKGAGLSEEISSTSTSHRKSN